MTLSADGIMAFGAAKDFETPDEADQDGDYEVTVSVTDGANPVDATLTIRLTDVDEVAPVVSSATVDGDALTLTFSEVLDGSASPASSAFSVAVGGTARGVSNVSMSASTVTLTLASAVVSDETVTVGYTVSDGRERESTPGCGGECGGRILGPGGNQRHAGARQHAGDRQACHFRHGTRWERR